MEANNHNNNRDSMAATSQRILEPSVGDTTTTKYPSITEIKSKIPKYFFESDTALSLYYTAKDAAILCILFAAAKYMAAILPIYLLCIWYPVYWFMQGTYMMSLFVVGHDCGHGSFSRYPLLNDIVGNITNTLVLTPYYPWKLSHRHHHKNTGNIDKDEVFYPIRRKYYDGNGFSLWFGLGFGWYWYLYKGYEPRTMCHFNPYDKMYTGHVTGCVVSLLMLAAWVMFLINYACANGVIPLLLLYLAPVIVFASWMVIVTFLHHIEVDTPWYSDDNWGYVKGQTSSIDRKYGWAHDVIHSIGTHQIHHLFCKIPHYHLEGATVSFRKSFPQLVRKTDARILPSFVRMFSKFVRQFVTEDDSKIHYFH